MYSLQNILLLSQKHSMLDKNFMLNKKTVLDSRNESAPDFGIHHACLSSLDTVIILNKPM